ncbi:hypothetical protein [Burkholderia lata]|uniref:hypothetical protein n=1 Tax=Burkholderia lata (strain ATCC 17760 / DSM 23089 / LMG 22485 / NCIMB 9086 / R18194 / 383) TaxID=482957 RepID=UPI001427C46C|nr:hypothetical protein [Burkholderia lata]
MRLRERNCGCTPGTLSGLTWTKSTSMPLACCHSQLIDTDLLALARAHKGKQATFDRRLAVDAVLNGAKHLELIS